MLRLGVGPHGPVVLTVPGRRSGKPRSTLVTPMSCGGRRYVVSGFAGADWRLNIRAAGEVTLQRGGTRNAFGWSR
jgi:deazaflavin-dependent oxidoreductase (nitroreductase family)